MSDRGRQLRFDKGEMGLAEQRLLEGKTAIITGSTSGIGEAIARLYARHGAKVTVTGRHLERGRDIVRSIEADGGEAWFVGANLADHQDCVRMVEAAANRFHGIDILVNNAAMVCSKSVKAITTRDWDELFAVNLKAPFLLAQAALPWLEKSGQGQVINVSSINAVRNGARNLVYDSLKAGLNHMTRGLALDLRKKGIRCNALMPGGTHTPLLEQWAGMYLGTPEKLAASKAQLIGNASVAEPGQIAGAALMLACDYSSWVNGAEIAVDGGCYLGPESSES